MNQLPREVAESVQLLDLGCGVGQSLRRLEQLFGVSAIGLERSRKRVREAQEAGRRVYEADVLDLRPDDFPAVEYVVFDNVLGHLADLQGTWRPHWRSRRLAFRRGPRLRPASVVRAGRLPGISRASSRNPDAYRPEHEDRQR
ncbi:MAG: class I SAM-dependent methyltransferase, partial [Acidimicrobiia bacterium]|nr:class I SAM-dependent methyltransferase [Acidimicrobiia bacterium]